MPRRRHSRYIFETAENWRTFRHELVINNLRINCQSCHSRVAANEPYSHHWLEGEDATHIKLSLEEKLVLRRIERERIECFLLCDESASERTSDFLLEAGTDAVPQLLRFLFYEATRMGVTIGFFVKINQKREHMYYETSEVQISHFLDINETVDLLFSLLLEKISNYLALQHNSDLEGFFVKRLKVTVKRQWTDGELQLPLQYRVKCDVNRVQSNNLTPVDMTLLTDSYLRYQGKQFGDFPASLRVNLYCFRMCASSKELYAVPYLLTSDDVNNTPTFIIQNDVTGEFRGLHEIRNIRHFLRADSQDHLFVCRLCKTHFADRAMFALHKQINCGSGFVVWQMDEPTVELHANCFVLPKQYFKHAWFGLGR
ncbi:protein terminus [Scaptodrosophila lebanonensis]|uniref:Protein terminus n=1 Tax=Drosophila lebanonensis TaxID=7225 RepID=A0A6J2TGM9_DROLE|nr:protein terminus [Scaptodrosophila lebanonensis]